MADSSESGDIRAEAGTAEAAQVFISYASPDAAVAFAVVEALEKRGIACWIAPRDVLPGALYADAIIRAINVARTLVVVLSESAIASPHVGKEVERASSKRRPIIALRIDDAPLNPALEYFLSESQWIDARGGDRDRACASLLAAIAGQAQGDRGTGAPRMPTTASAPSRQPGWSRQRKLLAIVFTAVALGLVALIAVRHGLAPRAIPDAPASAGSATVSGNSIAVLPFVDMSEKKDQAYFGDGMAEEIIDLLVKVPNLRVPARTSSFYFRDKPTKAADIARELAVANILEGSVRRSGNRLRVTVQLIRADTGYHVWSETYDRPLDDVFAVQDEIANAVVQSLQITLMGGPLARRRGGTQNLEAYQLYLRALSAMFQGSRSSLIAARDDFDKAIKLDPNFGLAWAELSRDTLFLTNNGLLSAKEGYERARQLAQHALQVSPELAEAHGTLANVHRNFDWDWDASAAEVRLALDLDPTNSAVLTRAGQLAYTLGRWDDAERQLRLALVRDPLFTVAIWSLGTAQYGAGQFAEADASFRSVLALAPDFFLARPSLAKALLAEGKADEALAMVQTVESESERQALLPIALQAAGRQSESDEALKVLVAKFADTKAYHLAMTYAYRNDSDRAIEWLERAYRQREPDFVEILGEPLFANLIKDPRFEAFLRKMKLRQ